MLKKILIALASLSVLVLLVGLLLPGGYRVERSALIHAPPEVLHGFVADLERWKEWTPWRPETSAGTQWLFGGPRVGVGAVRSWSGEHGTGTLSLTQADPQTGVAYDTSLEGGRYLMHGRISFIRSEAGTRVTWVEEGSVGANPLMHSLRPLLESRLGARFEEALAQLQKQAEATPAPVEVKPVAAPVAQAAAPVTPPASSPPAASAGSAPAASAETPSPGTTAAEVAQTGGAPGGPSPVTDGGLAGAPPSEGAAPAEQAPAQGTPPAPGTEPASASAVSDKETVLEKRAPGERAPSAPASAPVAGQGVPAT